MNEIVEDVFQKIGCAGHYHLVDINKCAGCGQQQEGKSFANEFCKRFANEAF